MLAVPSEVRYVASLYHGGPGTALCEAAMEGKVKPSKIRDLVDELDQAIEDARYYRSPNDLKVLRRFRDQANNYDSFSFGSSG